MPVNLDPSLYLKNQSSERTPSTNLGKDEFLKILMAQLQNQDPSNPMDDKQFISQMAQFSSLEQTMNMAKSIDSLVESQMISPVIKYSHMIGKEVSYRAVDEETGEKGEEISSQVVSVSQHEGWAVLELKNGDKIYADAAIQVSDPTEEVEEEG
ncbi:flagellar basal body rod modification protein [Oceanobacillus picturae]|uniref:Flagellar basal body rod modification protein n=1 Tax=Oceanobacillus picturae TaxID=171693 RepID=W9B6E8_9BACI|nr:flagellar hook assembly protein FlgD [Oceanobacillus picturae]RIU96364.1 flagellar hook assembly protein FlgD [Oceanobacillus picturae]CDO02230.1 flagellar basal body rod modification protein [Oceanobacillus picturae]